MTAPGPFLDGEMMRRLVDDVQRLGLSSASAVADRFAALVRGVVTGDGDGSGDGVTQSGGEIPGLAAMIDGWRSIMSGMVDMARGLANDSTSAAPPGGSIQHLELPNVAAGERVRATAHLHNTKRTPVAGITLRVSDLVATGGEVIPAAALSITPDHIAEAPAGSSHAVDISVTVSIDQPTGLYHGLLMMSEPPDGVLVLRLDVAPPSES